MLYSISCTEVTCVSQLELTSGFKTLSKMSLSDVLQNTSMNVPSLEIKIKLNY